MLLNQQSEAAEKSDPSSALFARVLSAFVPALCVALAVIVVFHDLIAGRLLATNDITTNDLLFFNYPVRALYAEALHRHEFPFWSPYIGGGFPIFAEGQGGFLYPPNLVLCYLLPPVASLDAFLVLHAFVMGMGMFRFCARLTGSRWTALPSAAAAAICGSLICGHTRHPNAFAVISLSPWLFYYAERFAVDANLRWAALAGVIGGLMILAGHPQFMAIAWIVSCGYLILRVVLDRSRPVQAGTSGDGRQGDPTGLRRYLRCGLYMIAATTAAVMIGLPQLRATAQLASLSSRQGSVSDDFANQGTLPWNGILTFFAPYYAGDARSATFHGSFTWEFWGNFHYVGAVICVLALIGIVFGKRNPGIDALAVVSLVSYLMAVGDQTPLYGLTRHLPLLSSFRCPDRWLLGTELGLLAIASSGVRELHRLVSHRMRFAGGSAGRNRENRVALAISLALVGSVVLEIDGVAGRQVVTVAPKEYLDAARASASRLDASSRFIALGDGGVQQSAYDRSEGWSSSPVYYAPAIAMLPPNLQAAYHISSLRPYAGVYLEYASVISGGDPTGSGVLDNIFQDDGHVAPAAVKALRLWGAGNVVSDWSLPSPFAEQPEAPASPYHSYRLPGAFPRAWVVGAAVPTDSKDDRDVAAEVTAPDFDPHRTALVSSSVPPALPAGASGGHADIISATDNTLVVRASAAGLLVVSDTWYPSWHATVDGVPSVVYRVNSSMRGIASPHPGAVIRMWFDDDNMGLWTALAVVVTMACVWCGVYASLRAGSPTEANSQ